MSRTSDRFVGGLYNVLAALSIVKADKPEKPRLRAVVHEATGRSLGSRGKFMVTAQMGDTKFRTALKKPESLKWEESVEFASKNIPDKIFLKLKKTKKRSFGEKTIGSVTIDVKEALAANGHLPAKRRYLVQMVPGYKQKNAMVFLEVSLIACGELANDKTATFSSKDAPQASEPPVETDANRTEMISSINDLWEVLESKRSSAKDTLKYIDTLRSKLAVEAPHVLDNVVVKNLAANVPTLVKSVYQLPEMDNKALEELKDIEKVVRMLSDVEESRLHFLNHWYVEELCRLAMEEAPQVLQLGG